jgi:D-inositol-3-phosphate glycosyltransferase
VFGNAFSSRYLLIKFLWYFNGLLASIFFLIRYKIKIVHVHIFNYGIKEFLLCFFCKIFAFRIVGTIHDVESFVGGGSVFWKNLIISLIDHFVVHNNYSYNEVLKKFKISKNKLFVVPHGNFSGFVVNYSKEYSRRILKLKDNEKIILFFGQIKKVKGLDVLISSVSKIKNYNNKFKVLVAGKYWKNDGFFYDQMIRESNLVDYFRFDIGYVPDSEVPYYYSAADIIVLPYKEIFQSGVLIMSMGYSRPVVVSNIPGMTEMVVNGENGLVFESGNPDDLAEKIRQLLDDEFLCKTISENALKYIDTNYTWTSIGFKLKEIYLELR